MHQDPPSENSKKAQSSTEELRRTWTQQRRDAARREDAWSWTRLGTFLLAIVPWFIFAGRPALAALLSLALLLLFVLAVWQHQRAQRRREAFDRRLLMLDEAAQRTGGRVACVRAWARPDDGAAEDQRLPALRARGPTWPLSPQEQDDLDLYAEPVGLFGLLNRASTDIGARRLRDWLEHSPLAAERILAQQEVVRWLAERPEARLEIMAGLAVLRREDRRLAGLIRAIDTVQPLKLPLSPGVLRVAGVINFVLIVASMILSASIGGVWTFVWIGLLLLNVALYAGMRRAINAALEAWEDTHWPARGCRIAAAEALRHLPTDQIELAPLRTALAQAAAARVLPRLHGRTSWAEHGGLAAALLNVLIFFELHVADAILRTAVPNRDVLLCGISALAELDALCSLASFASEQPVTCWSAIAETTQLNIAGGVHPLIPPERVVANDLALTLQTRLWIVTGSNMAGKSTFLRMAGVNVLLAQLGCPATATAMHWSPIRLITDLRVRDNLAQNESYFLAEVRHLRRMILPPDGATPILGLMDEPFRGTNSEDQTAASVAVVGRLQQSQHLYLLATHDRHLTSLADGRAARNFHFRENLAQGGMVFDYRLHDGPAQSRNALRVLEREGYPPDVMEAAHAWLSANDPAANDLKPGAAP